MKRSRSVAQSVADIFKPVVAWLVYWYILSLVPRPSICVISRLTHWKPCACAPWATVTPVILRPPLWIWRGAVLGRCLRSNVWCAVTFSVYATGQRNSWLLDGSAEGKLHVMYPRKCTVKTFIETYIIMHILWFYTFTCNRTPPRISSAVHAEC